MFGTTLARFVYVSRMRKMIDDADIRDIRETAIRNNLRNAITGVLVCGARTFLQVLEGERALVNETVSKILVDPRHNNLRVVSDIDTAERLFPSWSMAVFHAVDDQQGQTECKVHWPPMAVDAIVALRRTLTDNDADARQAADVLERVLGIAKQVARELQAA